MTLLSGNSVEATTQPSTVYSRLFNMDGKPIIPDPCPNSWSLMHPADGGRHCKGCDHLVVDFRGKSNEEILQVLRSNAKTCGHFSPDQLAHHPLENRSWFYRLKYGAAVMLALIGFQMKPLAQTVTPPNPKKYEAKVCPVEDSPGKKKVKHKRYRRRWFRRRGAVRGRYIGSIGTPSF